MKKVAIIGFGRAGHSAAETLRNNNFDGEICVYTDLTTGVENPMLTTYYGSEKIAEQDVMPFGNLTSVSEKLKLDLRSGVRAKKLFPKTLTVISEDALGNESTDSFDDIIIATGSAPILPDFEAKDPQRIITMRNLSDARRMNYALHNSKRVLVVGCSMIGIKVVQGLSEHNADISFVDFADRVFPTAVLPGIDKVLEKIITDKGIWLKLSLGIKEIRKKTEKLEVEFSNGSRDEFDSVFLCMGTKARTDIIEGTSVESDRAIKVDEHMRTNISHIYAAGDCCEAKELSTGNSMNLALWANAAEQGKIAADNILGLNSEFEGNLICNITHFWDTDFVSIGNNKADGESVSYFGKNPERLSCIQKC